MNTASFSSTRRLLADYLGMATALSLLIVIFGLSANNFLSAANFRAIANQIPSAMLVATGMTYVLIIGGIDLSVGSVLGLCGIVLGVGLAQGRLPLGVALLLTLLVGAGCGAFNGLVSIRWKLPAFIVTLGMMEIARGGAHLIANSQTHYIGARVEWISDWSVPGLGLSLPFVVGLMLMVVAQLVLVRTAFGRYLVAIGINEEAVRLSGIDPRPVKLAVYIVTGVLVALAAIVDTARFQAANPNAGTGFELQAIAAAVIGGTSLMGGRGSVMRTFFGVLIIAVLTNGLAAIGAKDETKRLVTGAVIIAAVILDQYRQRSRAVVESPAPRVVRAYGWLFMFVNAVGFGYAALATLVILITKGEHLALVGGGLRMTLHLLFYWIGRGMRSGSRGAVRIFLALGIVGFGAIVVLAFVGDLRQAAGLFFLQVLLYVPPLVSAFRHWNSFK